jgi:hypothetical protein
MTLAHYLKSTESIYFPLLIDYGLFKSCLNAFMIDCLLRFLVVWDA